MIVKACMEQELHMTQVNLFCLLNKGWSVPAKTVFQAAIYSIIAFIWHCRNSILVQTNMQIMALEHRNGNVGHDKDGTPKV